MRKLRLGLYAGLIVALINPQAIMGQQQSATLKKLIQKQIDASKEEVRTTFHGMLRVRPEVKENQGFSSGNKYEFVGQKLWLDINHKLFEKDSTKARLFIKLQDARIWGGQSNSVGGKDASASRLTSAGDKIQESGVDIREAFGEIDHLIGPFGLKIGRQRLNYGEQRMISPLDWANVGITFDAALFKFDTEKNSLHFWASILREGDALDLKNTAAYEDYRKDTYFFGIYDSIKSMSGFHMDLYFLSWLNTFTVNEIHTAGIRFSNRTLKGFKSETAFDFTIEGAYQFGYDGSGTDIQAFAAGISSGYTIGKVRIGLNFDVASGDDDTSDTTVKTFHNMFPLNHAYYGQADLLSWQNLIAGEINFTFFLSPKFKLKTGYIYAMRYNTNDNWYPASGGGRTGGTVGAIGTVAGANLSTEQHSLHEIDVTTKFTYNKYFSLMAGYSLALRGAALTDKSADSDYHYGFLSTQFNY